MVTIMVGANKKEGFLLLFCFGSFLKNVAYDYFFHFFDKLIGVQGARLLRDEWDR
jgi:hypothetical protein